MRSWKAQGGHVAYVSEGHDVGRGEHVPEEGPVDELRVKLRGGAT